MDVELPAVAHSVHEASQLLDIANCDAPVRQHAETPAQVGHVDDCPSAVASASAMVDRLRMSALSERESLALIRKIMEDHKA